MQEITPEQISKSYSAMIDSANLIINGKSDGQSDDDWSSVKSRNQEHLKLMLAKDFWTDEDFTLVNEAIEL